jgi:hypothetical protein
MSGLGTLVTATDYNRVVGYDPTTDLYTFNAVWGKGSGKFGYGQTPAPNLENPSTNDIIVEADLWATYPPSPPTGLLNKVALAGLHQGTAITQIFNTPSAPAPGATILADVLTKTTSSIENLYTNHLNAAGQGASIPYQVVNENTWRNSIEFTHTVTFADAESTRFFFNCGGQLALTFGAAPGIQINALMANLAQNAGTVVFSSPNVETIKIAGTDYKGVTKVGGTNPLALDPRFTTERYGVESFNSIVSTVGYYGMSTSYQEVFKQSVGGFPSLQPRYHYYDGSYISVSVKSNGPVGVYGDNGNVITIKTLWDQIPNGLQVTAGTSTTLSVRPPLLRTGMTRSWGIPVVSGVVSGN